jgi:hypothetical protein
MNRRYTYILETLGNIGGLSNIIMLIFALINTIYNEYHLRIVFIKHIIDDLIVQKLRLEDLGNLFNACMCKNKLKKEEL